ncbi:hypothetical protein Cni_G05787 [Canna indica]|uniref:Uncharacterized protein n=1 Tax=Canna indica TaxID=4628 RepID=A0AAQ3JXI8_9LILI|nr:hypothetical protein Cni_G05787 [Canna indica]
MREHITTVENELESELRKGEASGPNSTSDMGLGENKIKSLRKKLDSCYEAEHVYWKQRAKVKWINDGDRNTKFFHQVASGRKQKNWISSIVVHGISVNHPKDIAIASNDFFRLSIGTHIEKLLKDIAIAFNDFFVARII